MPSSKGMICIKKMGESMVPARLLDDLYFQKRFFILGDTSKGLFRPKTRVFFCCGNSPVGMSKPHTFKLGPFADAVLCECSGGEKTRSLGLNSPLLREQCTLSNLSFMTHSSLQHTDPKTIHHTPSQLYN